MILENLIKLLEKIKWEKIKHKYKKCATASLSMLLSLEAFAAGDGGGPASLIYPAINFAIFVFLLYKTVIPFARKHFVALHEATLAKTQEQERNRKAAEEALSQVRKSKDQLPQTVEQMREEADQYIKNLRANAEVDLKSRLQKLEEDFERQKEMDAQLALKKIEQDVLESIVHTTKDQVHQDRQLRKRVESKLTSEVSA